VPETAGSARLAAYDLLGRRVWARPLEPGRSVQQVPAAELATGAYVIRLETARGSASARLTVVR
jgi:hypothetical protein